MNRVEMFPVNVATLEQLFDAGASVDLATLQAKGLIPKRIEHIKILGEGDLTKKLSIKAHGASAVAKEKVEKAGGSIEIVATAAPAKASA
jgi:large subunit ribosomal protein L15